MLGSFEECKDFMKRSLQQTGYIQWGFVSTSYKLPLEFILEHEEDLDFNYLYRSQKWDEETLRIFQDKIPWSQVDPNEHSKEFLREFKDKFKFGHYFLRDIYQKEFGNPENYDDFFSRLQKLKWLKDNEDWFT